jgi:hypothetical protein
MAKRLKEKLTISDFKVSNNGEMDYVEWDEIKKVLGVKRWKDFNKFMTGQTCSEAGAYKCDVENFLRPKNQRFFD